ncbi:MAG: hypothetical protein DSZ27_00930 [Thiomicrospira sp.]|nr:MAG: hypothetical protein DSZ27_00930 [Thiomicrospira sp.]
MPDIFDKTSSGFWYEFEQATEQEYPTQIKKASNLVRVSAINFPSINTQTIEEYFLYQDSVTHQGKRDRIVFHCCEFEDFEVLKINAAFEFEGCTFAKQLNIESNGKGLKFKHTKFLSEANISGNSSSICQLQLNDCYFKESVCIKNFDFLRDKSNVRDFFSTRFHATKFAKSLVLENVTFQKELTFNSVVWPKKIIADRDIFRQLKVCMEEQKNILQANVFHSLEMDEYRKELSWTNVDDWQDLFVFTVNKVISNNTLSWWRPLFWIFVASYIFYGSICGFNAIKACGWNGFFHFMNPLNRSSELYHSVYTTWFIHKVIMVFLVYHLVVALKRKTKF